MGASAATSRTLLRLTLWEIFFVVVIVKIPVAYVGWVVWWAIKAEPEVGTQGGTEGVNWKPWQPPSDARPRRRGPVPSAPHGVPERSPARGGGRRDRISA